MSKLKELRETIDTQLDRLDAHLDAWEAQLESSRDKALGRVQDQKQKLAEVEKTSLSDQEKQDLKTKITERSCI